MPELTVEAPGPLALVQDAGRSGSAHQGVPRSGFADAAAATLANRLVGNAESAAVVEATLGGLTVRFTEPAVVAVTGAPVRVEVDGRPVGMSYARALPAGARLVLSPPTAGLRTYLAVRGGLSGPGTRVLGSWSADVLSGFSRPLEAGDRLAIGAPSGAIPDVGIAAVPAPVSGTVTLLAHLGPRADRFAAPRDLFAGGWATSATSNRIGVRLDRSDGPPLAPAGEGQLPSEGVPLGAIQVPPGGQPVIFGPDHPVTGGYPVIAVLDRRSLSAAFQLRPGQPVRIRPA
ncbi:biotin-dependent carboxyltransferase family protein [Tsukamurella sp. 1534]|uniref:5-oxoprolinase subunit C family protein n=1 Tax=Tsukamurella sp. 1534 TaxID=1151061 RepID=UPI000312101B|nr:biotin-dependent carboxyltransferase family protein [Tsukamurella sp. 1534]